MKKLFLLAVLAIGCAQELQAQVGIGTTTPDASAALDVTSSTRGILIPRIAAASRPATPATGLMIYQTDSARGFYYYDGSGRKKLSAAADTLTHNLHTNGYTITGDGSDGITPGDNGYVEMGGMFGSGPDITYSRNYTYDTTHFAWDPRQSALRAGTSYGTEWDWANMGNYSPGAGYGIRASGNYSVALGNKTQPPTQAPLPWVKGA